MKDFIKITKSSNGLTLIELIVSLGLISIILIFLMNLYISTKNIYNQSNSRTEMDLSKNKLITYINSDVDEFSVKDIEVVDSNSVIIKFSSDDNGNPFDKELVFSSTNKVFNYKCNSCGDRAKLSNTTIKLPSNYTFSGFNVVKNEESRTINLKINGKVDGKNSNINVYVTYYPSDVLKISLAKHLYKIVEGEADINTNVLTKASSDESCTNTLAYDKTFDNNLRFVGKNPCNYIQFNGELWRIIGVMNNVVNENKDSQSRVKIIRNDVYTTGDKWDSSNTNSWANSSLKNTLNTTFYNTLNAEAKSQVESSLWYLGGAANANIIPSDFYKAEKGTNVYTSRENKIYAVVGLPYPSDYGFAVGGTGTVRSACLNTQLAFFSGGDCYTNNYLYTKKNYWFITPDNSNGNKVFKNTNNTAAINSSSNYNIYPTIYLKSSVLIDGGNGSKNSPYKITT